MGGALRVFGGSSRHAEASGTRAKTDAVDARVLAQMDAALTPDPDRPVSEASRDLKDLQVARTGLVKERNRGQTQGNRVLKRQTKTRLALVERQIKELDAEIAKRIAGNEAMAHKREILRSIPGRGRWSPPRS